MKAVIIAGGLGTRLGKLTEKTPKALVTVRGRPLIEHQLIHLRRSGISDIIICIGHLSESIRSRLGDGSAFGVRITYLEEKELLGTGGALRSARSLLDGTFIVLYGDLLVEMDLGRLVAFHKAKGGLATLTVHESSHPYDSDIIEVAPDSSIVRFLGKPKPGSDFVNICNAGVYCMEPAIFKYFPEGISMLDREALPSVLTKGGRLFAYMSGETVADIGTLERLEKIRGGHEDR